mmetsp:Transcript_22669/g.44476  ORF Transcript_22669/g.44476 Transcript_22669/m.44476 type:complete len:243 (+) Transcript_22669:1176-1904(+)
MERHLAQRSSTNDNVYSRFLDALDLLLHQRLLAAVVVKQLIGVSQTHGSLGLRASSLNGASEDGHLSVLHAMDETCGRPTNHHALEHCGHVNVTSNQLSNADVVHIEGSLCRCRRDHKCGSLGAEVREQCSIAELLRVHHSTESTLDLVGIADIPDLVADNLVKLLKANLSGTLVATDNLRSVDTDAQKALGLVQELRGEGDDEVGAVTKLLLLHLGSHNHHTCRRMLYLKLTHNSRSVRGD